MQIFGILILYLGHLVNCQGNGLQANFVNALSGYPGLSTFRGLLSSNSSILDTALQNNDGKVTVLVPDNDAFAKFTATYGQLSTVSPERLLAILKYHILVSELTALNFTVRGGITIPTLLEDEKYNNRSASAQLATQFGARANGQVVFASQTPNNVTQIKIRQSEADVVGVNGGIDTQGDLNALDGIWEGGVFQSINTILEPPIACSKTIQKINQTLSAYQAAGNKALIWGRLDTARNVTCLAPSDAAFEAAGLSDSQVSTEDLKNALLYHTLSIPTYSNFLEDGQVLNSLSNLIVRITERDGDIYFNDAKLIQANVLTNNGLIHILDKVMSNANSTGGGGTASSTLSPSGTTTSSTGTPTNAGMVLRSSRLYTIMTFMFTALL